MANVYEIKRNDEMLGYVSTKDNKVYSVYVGADTLIYHGSLIDAINELDKWYKENKGVD